MFICNSICIRRVVIHRIDKNLTIRPFVYILLLFKAKIVKFVDRQDYLVIGMVGPNEAGGAKVRTRAYEQLSKPVLNRAHRLQYLRFKSILTKKIDKLD